MALGTVERVEPDPEGGPGFVFYAESPGEPYLQIPGSPFEADANEWLAAQQLQETPGTVEDISPQPLTPETEAMLAEAIPGMPGADVPFLPEETAVEMQAPPMAAIPAAVPPAQIAPPGMVPGAAQVTRQVGTPIAPETLAAEDAAAQEVAAAVQAEAVAGAQAREQQAQALETEAARIETAARDQRAREEQRREIERRADSDTERGLRDFMAMRTDPDRIWHEGGTGARITAAIGVAMGAFGSGLTGAPNFALQIINSAIERDMEAQRDDIRRAGFALDARRSITAAQRAAHQDDRVGDIAAEMSMREAAARRADALGRRAEGSQAQAHAATISATLRQQNIVRRTDFLQAAQDRVQVTTSYRPRPTGLGRPRTQAPPGYPQDVYANLNAAQQAARWDDYIKRQGRSGEPGEAAAVIPGARVSNEDAARTLDRTQRGVAQTVTANLRGGISEIEQARALRRRIGGGTIDTEARAAAGGLRESLIARWRSLFATGVPSDAEMERFEALIPNVAQYEMPWQNFSAQLDAAERMLRTRAETELGARGYALDPGPSSFRPAGGRR